VTVVAITREMGSLGTYIGMEVAGRLGYRFVREDITREAAMEYQVPERRLVEVVEERPGFFETMTRSARRYQAFVEAEVLQTAAGERVVIVGRWSTFLLRGIRHAVRVRVCAPRELRVARLAERLAIDRREAGRRIDAYDRAVSARIRQLFDAEWQDPLQYDLTIATTVVRLETAVEQVLRLMAAPEFQPSEESRQALADRALAARVRAALRAARATTRVEIDVRAERGRVSLAGTVSSDAEREAVPRVARAVEGVGAVADELRVTKAPPR
jgi:osmotically-inducible protein OsmY